MKTVALVTASTGRKELLQTVESSLKQTYPCKHYVFFDGVEPVPLPPGVEVVRLPVRTGGNGRLNGGIVASSAFLVTEDLICWCDDDNWLEPNHVETLVEATGENLWAHCLRKLMNSDGSFWDFDDCESLGVWTGFVDLNCYMMNRLALAVHVAPRWYATTSAGLFIGDRTIYSSLKSLRGECTGRYTVNYRLNSRVNLRHFFKTGNEKMREKFGDDLPWRKS